MQGYILHTQKVRDEDLLVYILTPSLLVKSYRFYGARHSNVLQGYKIDFELEGGENFLPHLRSVLHLGYRWLLSRERLLVWQQFMRLLYAHLRDVEQIDEVYFRELELCASRFDRGAPKRLLIESYVRILEAEGRLHDELFCFICDEPVEDRVALARSFLPAHEHCAAQKGFEIEKIKMLFSECSTLLLDDDEIDALYSVLLQGL